MSDNRNKEKSIGWKNDEVYVGCVARARDCIKTAIHYCRIQGSSLLTFEPLLKAIMNKSPFLRSQILLSMGILESELHRALEDIPLTKQGNFEDKERVICTPQVRDYFKAAQRNAKLNGRPWLDELDLFFALFLVKSNPLYQFLDQHNIPYKRIFEKKKEGEND